MTKEVEQLLWNNWEVWRDGGVSISSIQPTLLKKSLDTIKTWISENGFVADTAHLSAKQLFDLATWCLFGTDSLPYHPENIRVIRIKEAAKKFNLEERVIIELIASAPTHYHAAQE